MYLISTVSHMSKVITVIGDVSRFNKSTVPIFYEPEDRCIMGRNRVRVKAEAVVAVAVSVGVLACSAEARKFSGVMDYSAGSKGVVVCASVKGEQAGGRGGSSMWEMFSAEKEPWVCVWVLGLGWASASNG